MHANRTQTTETRGGVALDRLFSKATITGPGGVVATSCTSDYMQVQPGDIFVALPESMTHEEDGHHAVQTAVERGATAVVCEEPVPVFDVPTYLVEDSRIAWGRLCQALSGNPSQEIRVIAVTGTHGKSTTIALLESIFSLAGKHCGKISSLGCYDGMAHCGGIEVPTAAELAMRLERMVAAGCTHALIEVSSAALGEWTFAGIEFDAVCVTNVSEAHLDLHNSVQNYRRLKRRVLEHLAPAGLVALNADDPVSIKWLTHLDGPALTYGMKGQAEITAETLAEFSNEQVFALSAGNHTAAVRTAMIGEHHIANCLAAATVALSYGIDLKTIAAGLQAVEKLPGHMERIDCGQGYPVFVDSADTAESLRVSLRTARRISAGRVICVLGEPQGGNYSEQLAIAHVIRRMADLAITARPLPEEEFLATTGDDDPEIEVVADRRAAIARALATACEGDVVVIAGSRYEPQPAYGTLAFSEKGGDAALTRQLLTSSTRPARLRIAA